MLQSNFHLCQILPVKAFTNQAVKIIGNLSLSILG